MKSPLSTLLALCFIALAPHALAESKPPNIVLILSDDQSYTDYSFMGHEHIETPHLDQLASESALFRRGYVPTALCRPALMTLATGLYSHQNKITGNDPAGTPENAAHVEKGGKTAKELLISNIDRTGSLPQWLAKQGYVSHQSGKWWEGSYQRGGFTEGMTRGYPDKGGRHGDDGLKIGREGMEPVLDFIDRSVADEKPFFVWYAPFLPHTPHNPPERLLTKYASVKNQNKAKYLAMIEWLDETCGELMNQLKRKGVADNTLVLYLADNGWNEFGKAHPYENGVRTPFIAHWPGKIKPRKDERRLVSNIDVVPTILTAAGIKPPANLPGLNLLDEQALAKRDTLFLSNFAHDMASATEPEKSLWTRSCIHGKWKLVAWIENPPKIRPWAGGHRKKTGANLELFNLLTDPHETKNLANAYPEVVRDLVARIDNWWKVD